MRNSRALFGTSVTVGGSPSTYSYYANDNDIISVNTDNGSPSSYSVTIYLQKPKDSVAVYVLDQKGKASINNILIIAPPGYTIDDSPSYTIDDDNGSIYLLSDGSTWKIVSSSKIVSPILVSSYISVSNLTSLGLLDDTSLPNGCIASVTNLLEIFYLDKVSLLTPDSITIIGANSGSGNWIRLLSNNFTWSLQQSWYIDPVSGNDQNAGVLGQPIKTLKEWHRRVGQNKITIDMTIHILSDLLDDDNLTDVINFGADSGSLTITGHLGITTVVSGTLTDVTNCNTTSNQPWDITDSSLSGNWSDHISTSSLGKRLKITNNIFNECIAWMAKDLGSKKCRISQPSFPDYGSVKDQELDDIQIGNNYVIQQLPVIKNFNPTVNIPTQRKQDSVFVVKDLAIIPKDTSNPSPKSMADYPGCFAFYNCDLLLNFNGKQSFVNCRLLQCQQNNPQDQTWLIGGLFYGYADNQYDSILRNFIIDNRFMIQGARANCYGISSHCIISSIQIYDCPSPWRGAITVQPGGCGLTIKTLLNPLSNKEIFGTNNFAAGFRIYQGSSIQYDSNIDGITITGNTGDVILGTTDSTVRSYSTLPFFEVDKRKYNGVTIVTNLTAFNTINT